MLDERGGSEIRSLGKSCRLLLLFPSAADGVFSSSVPQSGCVYAVNLLFLDNPVDAQFAFTDR